jgi:branched-chain amino acid transport system ATP-binding protein
MTQATANSSSPALHLTGVGQVFGRVRALENVTLEVKAGERRAIIGTNGAGKTTLLNAIAGDFPPTSGRITYFGQDVTRLPAHQRSRLGIARTYQTSLLLRGLSVLENVFLAVRGARGERLGFIRPKADHPDMLHAARVLEQVGLEALIHAHANDLSHGQGRLLELAMALSAQPKIILLDEPAAGLSPLDRPKLTALLANLPRDLTLVFIEHDMDVALQLADFVTVMKDGTILAEGTPAQITQDERVQAMYLGHGAGHA